MRKVLLLQPISVYFVIVFISFFLPLSAYSLELVDTDFSGSLNGIVFDKETQFPLAGCIIELSGSELYGETDENGRFRISAIPVGSYTVTYLMPGYVQLKKVDIIIKSERNTFVRAELTIQFGEEITVNGGYFEKDEDQVVSTTSFSGEEVRRSPGSAGDVSRIMSVLPSVAKVNDNVNSLIVRGGSPYENGFYIDNIPVPNINHYPSQGSSGGPIGLVNVDLIADVTFYAGGFNAQYGDKLSSIMDITLRDGNRDKTEFQLDMNMAGFGILGEGPLGKNSGSWIVSVRRSYLDLLVDSIGLGVAPRYSDYQIRLSSDLTPSNTISLLGVAGIDAINFDQESSEENGNNYFGGTDIVIGALGLNWKKLWSDKGYSNTSISYNAAGYDEKYSETVGGRFIAQNDLLEETIHFRNSNHFRLSVKSALRFGFEYQYLESDYNNYFADYTDTSGNFIPEQRVERKLYGNKSGVYVNFHWEPLASIEAIMGARYDYYSTSGNSHISPRLSLTYDLTDRLSCSLSSGVFYQSYALVILASQEELADVEEPKAIHYVLGAEYMVTEQTRLTLEIYEKSYENFPLDPNQPELFPADSGSSALGTLTADGEAYSRGIELMIQKKLVENFYGIVSASFFRTEYRDYSGTWRPRIYDNRFLFNIEGGYRLNDQWEFSMKWVYAGGRPDTPLDLEASRANNTLIYDFAQTNEDRFPAYHTLNLRADRRYNYRHWNLIFFLDIWNVYNRKNIAYYYWNEIDQERDQEYQWSIMPIGGFELEF